MHNLWRDLRFGWRALRKQSGFTLIAVFTLALGIGATSTIFSFVNGVMLRPLPYQEPERLVLVDETAFKRGTASMGVSFPNFLDWRAQNQVFSGIAAYDTGGYTLTGSGEPEFLNGGSISYNTFEVLGVPPLLGRTFRAEEDQPEQDLVVILGYDLWQRRFGAKAEVVGQTISLNNRQRRVIGVMPPDFKFPEVADLWVPLALDTRRWTRTDHGLDAIARLKPGITLAQAQADLSNVARQIEKLNPVTNEGLGVKLDGLRDGLVSDYRTSLPILLGVVAFVLLIACVNVANLLLARATTRRKEIAVRAALGARRTQLFKQMLIESLLLGTAGGVLGLALAWWGLRLLLAAIPIDFPFWMKFTLDGRVIGFTVAVSLLTGLVFGTLPAWQASNADLNDALREGGRSGVGARRQNLRSLLVIAEVALSLVLLVGAGLMMRSFLRLQQVNAGFNPEHVLTARVGLPSARYDTPEKRHAFFQDLLAQLAAQPGVQAASAVTGLPLSGNNWGRSLTVEGFPVLSVGQAPSILHRVISPNYFRTLSIPILAGRDFNETDTRDSLKVTIVDERLAREYWPNGSALGKRIRFGPPEDNEPWHTIVGVVGEVKQERLDVTRRRSVYLPHAEISIGSMSLAVRTTSKPENSVNALRNEVKALDSNLPVISLRTMNEIVSRSVWQPRLYAILFAVFAIVALVLAAVGIYGVMAYAVTQRTQELGVRMALGAQQRDVLKLVLGKGMKLVVAGLVAGLVVARALTHLLQSLLFNISTSDPLTFAGLALLLATVALLACYVPARRATKVDPLVALRYE